MFLLPYYQLPLERKPKREDNVCHVELPKTSDLLLCIQQIRWELRKEKWNHKNGLKMNSNVL